jgi:hypothetical protein
MKNKKNKKNKKEKSKFNKVKLKAFSKNPVSKLKIDLSNIHLENISFVNVKTSENVYKFLWRDLFKFLENLDNREITKSFNESVEKAVGQITEDQWITVNTDNIKGFKTYDTLFNFKKPLEENLPPLDDKYIQSFKDYNQKLLEARLVDNPFANIVPAEKELLDKVVANIEWMPSTYPTEYTKNKTVDENYQPIDA